MWKKNYLLLFFHELIICSGWFSPWINNVLSFVFCYDFKFAQSNPGVSSFKNTGASLFLIKHEFFVIVDFLKLV